jgi:ABC-type phosphate transport system substrate-binding protein
MHIASSQKNKLYPTFGTLFLLALSSLLVACGSNPVPSAAHVSGTSCSSPSQLQGAGSTFEAPLFTQMFAAYAKSPCGLAVFYFGGGSSAGLNALLDQSVDFGATDVPWTDVALARSQYSPILHIPITLGTEAIIYHVPGVSSQLKLTGPLLANIFLGKITAWNDPAIAALNSNVTLPPSHGWQRHDRHFHPVPLAGQSSLEGSSWRICLRQLAGWHRLQWQWGCSRRYPEY